MTVNRAPGKSNPGTHVSEVINRSWRRRILLLPVVFTFVIAVTQAQTINIDRLAADLEPEIQRAMIEGKIPSATVALVSGDRIIWTGAYGYSNIWARTPATRCFNNWSRASSSSMTGSTTI
jgi:CubicO group peptidase (beta-lactamase class C family)